MGEALADAVALLLEKEGGLVDHPADPGGITKYGISLRFLKGIRPQATEADIRKLGREEAATLYRVHFWEPCRLAELPPELASQMLVAAVNVGVFAAVRCLQRAIRAVACRALVEEDGRMGPKSIEAVRRLPQDFLQVALRSELAGHYRLVVARNPDLSVFLPGWLARAYS